MAPGVAGRLLVAAWRDLAETGGAACVLRRRHGVLALAWVNNALCDLLAVDAGQLAGRPLRDLVIDPSEGAPSPPVPPSSPVPGPRAGSGTGPDAGPAPDAAGPGVGDRPEGLPDGFAPGDDTLPIGWAAVAHRLARGRGGVAVALLERPDGTGLRVQVRVSPVSEPEAPFPDRAPLAEPGEVGSTPSRREADAWLVTLDPLGEALADVQVALATAEHRFDALARCAPVGIFASDGGLRLGYVNDRFVALTGLEAHALLGTGWLDAVHRDDLPAICTAVQTVLGGSTVEITVRLVREEDRQCWLQLRLAPTTTPGRAAGFIGTAEDVTQRRSWEEHLTYQARHDPLTGLVNRRWLIEVLAELLNARRQRDREFAVLFLDLDGFKEVNDSYGHEAGDRALIEVARRMQKAVRETDVLARVAGDEFVVVLRQVTTEAEAAAAARRHLATFAAPIHLGRTQVRLSASVGVAMPSGLDTPESLLRAADQMMYEAKAAGHGLYRLAPACGEGR